MHSSRCGSCSDHVAENTVITWLIMHWSREWSVTDQMAITHLSNDCSCTHHVDDHTLTMWLIKHWSLGYDSLITWLRLQWSRCWLYTYHGIDHAWSPDWSCRSRGYHALITRLIMQWSGGYHTRITCLSCTGHVDDHTLITRLIIHGWREWSCIDQVATMHWSRG